MLLCARFTKRVKDSEGNVREDEMSVERYYFDVYSYTFKYPNLPAVDVGNKKKPTFLPLEVTSRFPFSGSV